MRRRQAANRDSRNLRGMQGVHTLRCHRCVWDSAILVEGFGTPYQSEGYPIGPLNRNFQDRAGAAPGLSVLQGQRPAVGFSNLSAQHQSNSRSLGFRGEERYEQVGGVLESRTLVLYRDFQH